VIPEDPDYWSPVNREEMLVLDDIVIEDGKMAPFYREESDHVLMGRYGNTLLVNGQTDYQLQLSKDEVVRFYITNVSNSRPYRFTIPGVQMKLVGGDAGKMEREEFIDDVIVAVSERVVVEAYFPEVGSFQLINRIPDWDMNLGKIIVTDGMVKDDFSSSFFALRTNKDVSDDIDRYRNNFDRPADKRLKLSLEMDMMSVMSMMTEEQRNGEGMMMAMDHDENDMKIEWEDSMPAMNANSNTENVRWKLIDEETGLENGDIDWNFQKGDVVKIQIFNDPSSMHPMQHPIHLHGQRFLVRLMVIDEYCFTLMRGPGIEPL